MFKNIKEIEYLEESNRRYAYICLFIHSTREKNMSFLILNLFQNMEHLLQNTVAELNGVRGTRACNVPVVVLNFR